MPISAQTGIGLKERVPLDVAPWYGGPSLLECLDNLPTLERRRSAPLVMPVAAKYRDMGTVIEGKLEAGVVQKGESYVLMPNRQAVSIAAIMSADSEEELASGVAASGDQVRLRLRGVEEEDIAPGFVLCGGTPQKPVVHSVSAFEAQIVILELRSILSAGFSCVLHVHSATEEVVFAELLHKLEKGTGRRSKRAPGHAKKGESIIARLELVGGTGSVCVERFEDQPQLGRFTLRDQVSKHLRIGQAVRPGDYGFKALC